MLRVSREKINGLIKFLEDAAKDLTGQLELADDAISEKEREIEKLELDIENVRDEYGELLEETQELKSRVEELEETEAEVDELHELVVHQRQAYSALKDWIERKGWTGVHPGEVDRHDYLYDALGGLDEPSEKPSKK